MATGDFDSDLFQGLIGCYNIATTDSDRQLCIDEYNRDSDGSGNPSDVYDSDCFVNYQTQVGLCLGDSDCLELAKEQYATCFDFWHGTLLSRDGYVDVSAIQHFIDYDSDAEDSDEKYNLIAVGDKATGDLICYGDIKIRKKCCCGDNVSCCGMSCNGDVTCNGGVACDGTCTAGDYTDATPYPKDLQTAWDAVMSMERLPIGKYEEFNVKKQLDHSKLHPYLQAYTLKIDEFGDAITDSDGNSVVEYNPDQRNLSATVSCLVEVIKDLKDRVEWLETELNKGL